MKPLLLAVAGVLIAASAAQATERRAVYEGRPRVIDGDGLQIGRDRLRLWGVDAPEASQQCMLGRESYHCGQMVKTALENLIAR